MTLTKKKDVNNNMSIKNVIKIMMKAMYEESTLTYINTIIWMITLLMQSQKKHSHTHTYMSATIVMNRSTRKEPYYVKLLNAQQLQ